MKYVKRSNTIGALNRGHAVSAMFGIGTVTICPPQPKFDMAKPPPYRLGDFRLRIKPKLLFSLGRFGFYYGVYCMEYFTLKDLTYSSFTAWRFSCAATVKITNEMKRKWSNET